MKEKERWRRYIDFLTLKKGNYEMPIVVQDYLQLFRRRRRRRLYSEEER